MKFNTIIIATTLGSLLTFTACKDKNSTNNTQNTQQSNSGEGITGARIAYIDTDTLSVKYDYILEYKEKFEQEQKAMEAELQKMQKDIQGQYINLKKKVDDRTISQDDYEKSGMRIQQMEQAYEKKAQTISDALMEKTQAFQLDYRSKIDNFIKEFNKDNKFDFVLTYKYGDATILYANKAFDITDQLVEALNKEYAASKSKPTTTSVDTTKK